MLLFVVLAPRSDPPLCERLAALAAVLRLCTSMVIPPWHPIRVVTTYTQVRATLYIHTHVLISDVGTSYSSPVIISQLPFSSSAPASLVSSPTLDALCFPFGFVDVVAVVELSLLVCSF